MAQINQDRLILLPKLEIKILQRLPVSFSKSQSTHSGLHTPPPALLLPSPGTAPPQGLTASYSFCLHCSFPHTATWPDCSPPLGFCSISTSQQGLLLPTYLNLSPGASLVAQWLRICLLMQGTRVRALVWEDPTCRRATRPVRHNYWACASGACAP